MSKYCLLVWGGASVGAPAHKDGEFLVGTFQQVHSFKSDMELSYPDSTYKIFHYHDIGGIGEELLGSESEEIVKRKGNKVTVKAGTGYCENVDKLAVITDNGNGYTVKFPSHSSVYPDIYMSLDYSQASYLFLGLQEFSKDWEQD